MRLLCAAQALLVLVGLALSGVRPAAAQTIGTNVTVLLVPTSGAGVRPISFGVLAPGASAARPIASAADSTMAGVGHFSFTGITGNKPVQLTFDFPSGLTHAGSGNSMPITFNGNYGLHCFDRNNGAPTCTLFNPSPGGADPAVVVINNLPTPQNGTLRVYLGGSVTVPMSVTSGTYQGVVSLTVARL